jgi:hyperosmotically inducible periplasmic protein
MKNQIKLGLMIACSTLIIAETTAIVGCAGDSTHRSTSRVIDDATLTTKIKADLYADPVVKGHEVSVNSYRGVVQLNGFVDTDEQKQRAGEIAQRFPQVVSVQNNLAVKPEPAGAEPKTPKDQNGQ